ncbi:MAG: FAD-dependent monooxygenase [Gammaproteobacteria bacterium]|nr:FAD-dependent monooxygenase [Gammaproteobacteria bacterium]
MAEQADTRAALEVAVVGGSIAGCAVAIELARAGCAVTLFERSGEELKDRGAGIGVPAAVIDTLIARDLVDGDIARFPAPAFLRISRTAEAPDYGRLAWAQPAVMLALNWGSLYRNLRRRVPDAVYRTRCQVTDVRNLDGRRPRVVLADGREHDFDLVVCADGYASLGRRLLFPRATMAYAGYVLWRGALAEAALDDPAPLERGIHALGYAGGHGIFYFVPGPDGGVARGRRLVNWGMYHPVPAAELTAFMTAADGTLHEGSLPPGAMPAATEAGLKALATRRLPRYYDAIVQRSQGTFAYAIYDCPVPGYRRGRVCLAGDAGAFARPHSGAGALKGMHDAIALGAAVAAAGQDGQALDAALAAWDTERTAENNRLVRFGQQLGHAFVDAIPDWSGMDAAAMAAWYESVVTIPSDYLRVRG